MEIEIFGMPMLQQYAAREILKCNDTTAAHGLLLTPAQAMGLAELRSELLTGFGRVELGGGIIDKLIPAFCSSPYLSTDNYADMIGELMDCFYEYKNETRGLMGDDDLIACMKALFDGGCGGSIELLRERELPIMADRVRRGQPIEAGDEDKNMEGNGCTNDEDEY